MIVWVLNEVPKDIRGISLASTEFIMPKINKASNFIEEECELIGNVFLIKINK